MANPPARFELHAWYPRNTQEAGKQIVVDELPFDGGDSPITELRVIWHDPVEGARQETLPDSAPGIFPFAFVEVGQAIQLFAVNAEGVSDASTPRRMPGLPVTHDDAPKMRSIVQLAYRLTPLALVTDDDEALVNDDGRAIVITQEALDALTEALQ